MSRVASLIALMLIGLTAAGCAQARTASASFDFDADPQAASYGDYLSARFAANRHDLSEAAKFYRASLDLDPSNAELLPFAFFYAACSGDIDGAADLAKRLSAAVPDDRAVRLTLAVRDLKLHDYKAARAEIAKSAAGPFTAFTVSLIDAWAAAGMGDGAAAAADLKSLHKTSGADALAYFNEALLAEYLGQNDVAEANYRLELKAGGLSPRVVDAYGRFLERSGRADDAKALYTTAAMAPAFSPISTAGLARIAEGKKPDPLIKHAEDGAAEALFGIAASLGDESNRDVSILYLRLTLYLQPDFDLATLLLADRLEGLDKYDDAIAAYRTMDKSSPYHRLAVVEIAINEARLNQTDKAIADLVALTADYPTDVDTWTALGDTYRQAKNFPEAAKAYDHAIAVSGTPTQKMWPLYYARAIAEQESNNWPAAESDLQLALKLSPDEPQVLNYLGYSWVDQHRNIKEALAMLEHARALSPQDGYIIDSVGWAYYRLGRYAQAAKALEDAVLLVPGDPTINDHLGDAYWKVGKKLNAQFQWSHAIAFGADDVEKAKIEKKLQAGLVGDNHS